MSHISEVTTFVQPSVTRTTLSSTGLCGSAAAAEVEPLHDYPRVFRNIFSTVFLGIYQTDLSGRRTSPAPTEEDELITGYLHPQDRKVLCDEWQQAMESGRQWSQRVKYRCADGRVLWLQAMLGQVRDAGGEQTGYQGCIIDMTAQLGEQERLAASEERYRVAVEAANAGIWDLDVSGERCYISPCCFEMLGYRPGHGDSRLEDWTNIMHPDYLEEARRLKEDCVNGVTQNFELELRLKTNEGKWRWFRCKGKAAERDDSGRAVRLAGTLTDINEAKLMEHLLRMEHDLLNLITATTPVGIMFIEPDGSIAFANPMAEKILGLSRQEIMARGNTSPTRSIILHEQHGGQMAGAPLLDLLGAAERLSNVCFVRSLATGGNALLSVSTAPYLDPQSKVSGTVVTLEDVTEQKRREQVLADSDRLLRETQRIAQLGSYVLDVAEDCWNCSSKLEEILGLEAMYPRTLRGHIEVVHEDFRESFTENYLSAVKDARPFDMEYKITRRSDGAERWVAECCELSRDASESCPRIIGTIKDITEKKTAEEEVLNLNDELDRRVSERTAQLAAAKKEIESFSYSVSHDLRAPLRHINSYSSILVEEFAGVLPEEARRYLDRICTASSRMGKQIDDLLALTRVGRAVMKRATFSISKAATEVVEMLRDGSGATEFLVQPGLSAYGDGVLVRLVLQNLLGNSVKYASRKPSPKVEFGQTLVAGRPTFFVRDNGVGFDMTYLDKLFQPFQRLHGSEFEGTGIGLATVRRIIERHGGSIWAEGEENEGATFYFTLSPPRKHELHS